jgi:hypothetical protein
MTQYQNLNHRYLKQQEKHILAWIIQNIVRNGPKIFRNIVLQIMEAVVHIPKTATLL